MSAPRAESIRMLIVKSDWMEDWWILEREEHDGREWFERVGPNATALCMSSRIGNADVEGSAREWKEIAAAIRARGGTSSKRCAAWCKPEGVYLSSPRNSIEPTLVDYASADLLAERIEQALSPAPDPQAGKGE